jgi:hypothetical protein
MLASQSDLTKVQGSIWRLCASGRRDVEEIWFGVVVKKRKKERFPWISSERRTMTIA